MSWISSSTGTRSLSLDAKITTSMSSAVASRTHAKAHSTSIPFFLARTLRDLVAVDVEDRPPVGSMLQAILEVSQFHMGTISAPLVRLSAAARVLSRFVVDVREPSVREDSRKVSVGETLALPLIPRGKGDSGELDWMDQRLMRILPREEDVTRREMDVLVVHDHSSPQHRRSP